MIHPGKFILNEFSSQELYVYCSKFNILQHLIKVYYINGKKTWSTFNFDHFKLHQNVLTTRWQENRHVFTQPATTSSRRCVFVHLVDSIQYLHSFWSPPTSEGNVWLIFSAIKTKLGAKRGFKASQSCRVHLQRNLIHCAFKKY